MANTKGSLPNMDDIPVNADGPTEAELLDAVMSSTGFLTDDEKPLPDDEIPEVDPSESDYEEEEDPEESDDVVNEESEEDVEEDVEEEVDEDAEATQEDTVFTTEDLDMDAKVRVKIDGEEIDVSFSDLIKGYSTEQSLSTKGRELGEARKQLEEEKAKQLEEVSKLGNASSQILMAQENALSKAYHDVENKIKKARASGDTFELNELKDKREDLQQKYWSARKRREGLIETLDKQQTEMFEKQWQESVNYFHEHITEYVPDFTEDTAMDLRSFALEEGLPEELINSITDPRIVKFVNDYRLLKTGVDKGAAKRKQAPAKKVPVKKAKSDKQKKASKDSMIKARAFREDASTDDQMDFLRQIAHRSLGN